MLKAFSQVLLLFLPDLSSRIPVSFLLVLLLLAMVLAALGFHQPVDQRAMLERHHRAFLAADIALAQLHLSLGVGPAEWSPLQGGCR